MTQRNTTAKALQAMPTGMPESPRLALALAVFVLISLITVLSGAGFGIV
jgi:hypothetical protein